MTPPLFVYGTLRSACDNPVARRLARQSRMLGAARLRGRLYEVAHYPALVLQAGVDAAWVHGELHALETPQHTLSWIDAYEECSARDPLPHEYERVLTEVEAADGGRLKAWVYVYQRPVDALRMIASGDYLGHAVLAAG